ncbi:MAG TPA: hypothetical protein VFB00_08700 [Terriglobales bacterium]|nr:hypothetical protein [Terriglobales bacterium]
MDRYMIETPHTSEECLALIKLINAQGYLWNFDWGCEAGVHTGWAILEAENEAEARLAVPPLVRNRARIIRLNKFDAATIEYYEKQEAPPLFRCELLNRAAGLHNQFVNTFSTLVNDENKKEKKCNS